MTENRGGGENGLMGEQGETDREVSRVDEALADPSDGDRAVPKPKFSSNMMPPQGRSVNIDVGPAGVVAVTSEVRGISDHPSIVPAHGGADASNKNLEQTAKLIRMPTYAIWVDGIGRAGGAR